MDTVGSKTYQNPSKITYTLNKYVDDMVNFKQDQKGTFVVGRHEAQCFPTKQGSHNFRAHSVRLCQEVMRLSGEYDVARLPIGEYELRDGIPSVTLIVRNNLNNHEDCSNSQIPISYDKRNKI